MRDLAPSLIRTYTPLIVASIVTWLAETGVVIDDDVSTALAVAIGGIAAAVYYAAVRFAEERWPIVGVLLGSTSQPMYSERTK